VPKANGYLNVGVGGMADKLKRKGDDIHRHWRRLSDRLQVQGLVAGEELPDKPGGYSYFLRGGTDEPRYGNAFVVCDSAGLATRDMCEGIGPAVRSGLLAARAIADGGDYRLDSVGAYTSGNRLVRKGLEYMFLN
jgi:menaquinone-9 beta-reductase